jgi:hypothetical protein
LRAADFSIVACWSEAGRKLICPTGIIRANSHRQRLPPSVTDSGNIATDQLETEHWEL